MRTPTRCAAVGISLGISSREARRGRTSCPVCRAHFDVTVAPETLAALDAGRATYAVVKVPDHVEERWLEDCLQFQEEKQ